MQRLAELSLRRAAVEGNLPKSRKALCFRHLISLCCKNQRTVMEIALPELHSKLTVPFVFQIWWNSLLRLLFKFNTICIVDRPLLATLCRKPGVCCKNKRGREGGEREERREGEKEREAHMHIHTIIPTKDVGKWNVHPASRWIASWKGRRESNSSIAWPFWCHCHRWVQRNDHFGWAEKVQCRNGC